MQVTQTPEKPARRLRGKTNMNPVAQNTSEPKLVVESVAQNTSEPEKLVVSTVAQNPLEPEKIVDCTVAQITSDVTDAEVEAQQQQQQQ